MMVTSKVPHGAVNVPVLLVCLLLLVTIVCSAKRCANLLTRFYLDDGGVPVMIDAYAYVPTPGSNMPSRHGVLIITPGVAVVMVLLLATVPMELLANFGIGRSDRCAPMGVPSLGICAKPQDPAFSIAQHSLILHNTSKWDDAVFGENPIYQGFHHEITGDEYFGPVREEARTYPAVISGCNVETSIIGSGEMSFRVQYGSSSRMSTIRFTNPGYVLVSGVYTGDNSQEDTTRGYGMVPTNFDKPCLIGRGKVDNIKNTETGYSVTLYEYSNWKHLRKVLNTTSREVKFQTEARVAVYRVSCQSTGLTNRDWILSVMTSRFAQLKACVGRGESEIRAGKMKMSGLKPPTKADIVRTVLGAKMSYKARCEGETWVWTKCATYSVIYAIPIISIALILLVMLIFLQLYAALVGLDVEIPKTAQEWNDYLARNNANLRIGLDHKRNRKASKSNRNSLRKLKERNTRGQNTLRSIEG